MYAIITSEKQNQQAQEYSNSISYIKDCKSRWNGDRLPETGVAVMGTVWWQHRPRVK